MGGNTFRDSVEDQVFRLLSGTTYGGAHYYWDDLTTLEQAIVRVYVKAGRLKLEKDRDGYTKVVPTGGEHAR